MALHVPVLGGSQLERGFDSFWSLMPDAPAIEAEVRFAPPRRFRFDRCHRASRVAVELEGGVWSGGRHTRGKGFTDDCTKYNLAASLGWLVFRFTGGMLDADPIGCLTPVVDAIRERDGTWPA